jgi:hypothetical protein
MTTMEIANRMIALCKEGKNEEALRTLFAENMVSVEAATPDGSDPVSHGLEAAIAKNKWWIENHEVHAATITGPWPNGDRFIVGFAYEVTFKPAQKRFSLAEAGLYTIENGKIVREEFFYSMG